jgi:hypothetical protein
VDPESKLVLFTLPEKRTKDSCVLVVEEVKNRTGGRTDLLFTSDEHDPYTSAIQAVYEDPKTGQMPEDLVYGTVRKERKKGRVVSIRYGLVFGTLLLLLAYFDRSAVSDLLNTSFVERLNATDRHRCARKARKTYRFSKEIDVHEAATYFTKYSYNFCWPVRTLSRKNELRRTPAMAAKLADHVWSLREWLSFPSRPLKLV